MTQNVLANYVHVNRLILIEKADLKFSDAEGAVVPLNCL